MKYSIWHAKNPTFGFGEKPKFPEEYENVALIGADSIDDVFRITNHIDSDWRMNPEVFESFKDRVRSTSVGDVVVDEEGTSFYCAPVGWTKIDA
jgi:hypothetical protein